MTTAESQYPLGSDPTELERLDHQGRMLEPATRMLFEAAGIRAGMRVLDLGSGAGDAAFVVAGIVGAAGEVVGIDRSADAVAKATTRALQRRFERVRFAVGDISEPAPGGPYDAIVTRLVLMYVPDPAAVLKTQAGVLRPGGIVAPMEFDITRAGAVPSTPTGTPGVVVDPRGVFARRHPCRPRPSPVDGRSRRRVATTRHAECAAIFRPGRSERRGAACRHRAEWRRCTSE